MPTTGFRIDGASSGLDFSAVIDALTSIQKRSVQTLEKRITIATGRKTALLDLSSAILGVQSASGLLSSPSFFTGSKAASSNESVLLATSNSAVPGSYLFEVKRLAQAQQMTTGGFASGTASLGLTGEMSFEIGGKGLGVETSLDELRAGAGVDRGRVQLSETVGAVTKTAVVDLRAAETVQDVVDAINANGSVPVTARVEGDRVALQCAGTGTVTVLDLGADSAASDLGLEGTIAAGGTKFGANVRFVTAATSLASLNDGAGVRSAAGADFSITAADGSVFAVDLGTASTLGDAIAAINSATGGAVVASLNAEGNALELRDMTGGVTDNLAVAPGGTSNAALDLGLLAASELDGDTGAATGRSFISGQRVVSDLNGLLARTLNGGTSQFYADGTPVAATDVQGVTGGAIAVTDRSGTTTSVDLSSRVRTAVTGVVSPDTLTIAGAADLRVGQTVRLTDGAVNEYAVVESKVDAGGGAFDVTFTAPVSAGAGAGVFRARETVNEIVSELNRAGAGSFAASLNNAGNGLRLTDLAGGPGTLSVSESGSTTARDLGLVSSDFASAVTATSVTGAALAGLDRRAFVNKSVTFTSGAAAGFTATVSSYDAATGELTLAGDPLAAGAAAGDDFVISGSPSVVEGVDVDPALLTDNTTLASLNAGNGVQPGKIRITDRTGTAFTVDLSQPDDDRVGDVVEEINAAAASVGSSLRARINDAGDGIQLSQAAGAGSIRVDEVSGGRTARDLRIAGTAPLSTPGLLDGTFEVRAAIASGDSLNAIVTKVNALGIPVSAAVVNDGSTTAPFRLSLISTESGDHGRVIIDTTVQSLATIVAAPAEDALLLSGGGSSPTLVRSATNTVENAVSGLTLDLRGTGGPVSVTVTEDTGAVKQGIQALVAAFNNAADKIDDLGEFDTETNAPSILFGDPTLRTVDRRLFDLFNRSVADLPSGSIRDFASMGITMGQDGRLSIDDAALTSALSTKLDEVRDFFTLSRPVKLDTKLADFRNGLGVAKSSSGEDFKVTQHDGTSVTVSLAGVNTVAQLLDRINTDAENTGDLVAAISPDGRSIQLTDTSTGAASFRVESQNGSAAAAHLGILQAVDGSSVLTGFAIDLNRDPGAARRALEGLTALTDAPGGLISGKTSSLDSTIAELNERIDRAEARIEDTIERLTRRFAALEEFLSMSNNTVSLLQRTLLPLSQPGGQS